MRALRTRVSAVQARETDVVSEFKSREDLPLSSVFLQFTTILQYFTYFEYAGTNTILSSNE
jgi:hypothetical protein